jgi:toxin ParE1/3/4
MRLIVSPDARRDLKNIARYSEREWGAERRERYVALLQERFSSLLKHPQSGTPRGDLGPHYRSLTAGRHVIFYRAKGEDLHILRVLHQRMDVKLHL